MWAAVCISNVLISVGATCLYQRELYHLNAYPAFTNQLNAVMQAVICAVCLGLLEFTGLARWCSQPQTPLCSWIELGFYLALQNALEISSIDKLGSGNAAMIPIFQQAALPTTLLISSVLLQRRYQLLHYAAACVVVAGVLISFLPVAVASQANISWEWALVYILSRVPQAMAGVRAEHLLAHHSSANSWQGMRRVLRAAYITALLALLFNVPAALVISWVQGHHGAIGSVFTDYAHGGSCLFFRAGPATAGTWPCVDAWVDVLAFALPGVAFAVSQFAVLQHASASTYFMLLGLELPLESLLLSVDLVMGQYVAEYHASLLWGIGIAVPGLALWARAEAVAASEQQRARKSTVELHTDQLLCVERGREDSSS
mmetsp:Transcript_22399/g.48902  ORF Transcript_22399/g.48902 Transcript_22399/m.48902 type:complete len:373 (+) Transcript_22399:197-1315(+)